MKDDESCGLELAASADIPEDIGALFAHVAANLRTHAKWVGSSCEAARREQEAMLAVAAGYDAVSAAAASTAALMREFRALPSAPHDPGGFDRTAFVEWMQAKIRMQSALAEKLLAHAEQSRRALTAMAG